MSIYIPSLISDVGNLYPHLFPLLLGIANVPISELFFFFLLFLLLLLLFFFCLCSYDYYFLFTNCIRFKLLNFHLLFMRLVIFTFLYMIIYVSL